MSNDFNHTHYPRARKRHRCEECGRSIGPGERYSRTAAVWTGEWFTNVACAHCAAARYLVDDMDAWYSEGFYGGLAEWLGDHWYDSIESARLKVCIDRRWERFDGDGLMDLPPHARTHPRIQREMARVLSDAA